MHLEIATGLVFKTAVLKQRTVEIIDKAAIESLSVHKLYTNALPLSMQMVK